ncbi:enoyl-CoA hydratase/isomerase family protein [Pseudomonas sp. N-137]|uniref:enoyl-CoA hydratase/isomerase family protein n=1 Tax=Pseudomonas sp. N-137 TaxID=3108452 RepID=UPI002ADEB051|nr:enoyl-CoA hydratase/isomerase family protein [Pseudomonas sp. N-137]MEA1028075.1 enoyl-CoA hydratase/isomerase family protein [Pseudomonas sp. N-137]
MNFSTFALQQDGAVLRLTFSNPPINLMNFKMVEELFQLAGRLQVDRSVKVVVLDSADPDFFIAHFDLNDVMAAGSDPRAAGKSPDINGVQALTLTWQMLPQITVAKINGRCRGGGLEFLLCLSMRFASTDSKFGFPEASAGFLASGGGATRSAMSMGPARALEFLLSSRDFSGEEAERYGLINRALPVGELDTYVEDLVCRLAKRSHAVVAMNREVVRRVFEPFVEPLFSALAAENDGLRSGLAGEEMQAGFAALLAGGQSREFELDLPGSLDKLLPVVK